ncbi:MAG: tRNA pseudouridine(55) synthase TruB [Eubacterium sp.]|nr:tRNA pseudouridine(55) synthase TruB [Eubacterium sp.]
MINGIINVYKEAGFTSHDVVAKLRGITKQKKIGHTGTLDPDATGVLPVCLGRATKVAGILTETRKTYECVLLLGVTTDTQDITGTVLAECSWEMLCGRSDSGYDLRAAEERVKKTIEAFLGPQMQIPPMYSALKKDGRKLYELAREGKVVEREPRPVHFYEIRILEINLPRVRFSVTCSRGTYIRTLCHDIGGKLGCGGCMERLVRTEVGPFRLEDALHLSEIENLRDTGKLMSCITPVDLLFTDCTALYAADPEADRLLHNGNPVFRTQLCGHSSAGEKQDAVSEPDKQGRGMLPEEAENDENGMLPAPEEEKPRRYRIYDSQDVFVGLFYECGGKLRPDVMFYDAES